MFLRRLKESKYATLILASIFAFTLFLQCCFFHYQAFHSILISALWNNPVEFFSFYAPKISISLFVASFVFLFKRKSWIIYVSFIISIWCIAELVYYRANGIFLDAYSFTMIGNMDGFWSSILLFLYIEDFAILFPFFIICVSYYLFESKVRLLKNGFAYILLSILIHIPSIYTLNHTQQRNRHSVDTIKLMFFNPFDMDSVVCFWGFTCIDYLRTTSPIHAIIYEIKNLLLLPFINDSYVLNKKDIIATRRIVKSNGVIDKKLENKLIIILVESFENWTISREVTPSLYNFIEQNGNVFYHHRITSQVKGGTSSDGQMIINTGLLPINQGATCYRFPFNTFPAFSKLYFNPCGLIPGNPSIWNQERMSKAYGIEKNIYDSTSNDSILFAKLNNYYPQYDYILAITMASHSPFLINASKSNIVLPEDMPNTMANYLKCISYTDEQLKQFLSAVQSDSILQNSTIVITGDHTIFPSEIRKEFSDYCKANNLDYKVEENYCPLIIYSPNIKGKTIIDEVAYQMDIYPTILHVIGAEDYYWKGFGVNLLDSLARQNRPISPEEAFELSDKLIRANYFKEIEDSLYSHKE